MAGESHVRPSCWWRFHSEATARPGASQEEVMAGSGHATSFVSTGVFAENGELWASRYFQSSLSNLDLLCTWIGFMFELYSLSLCRSSGLTCSIPSYRIWFCTHVWTFCFFVFTMFFHHTFLLLASKASSISSLLLTIRRWQNCYQRRCCWKRFVSRRNRRNESKCVWILCQSQQSEFFMIYIEWAFPLIVIVYYMIVMYTGHHIHPSV